MSLDLSDLNHKEYFFILAPDICSSLESHSLAYYKYLSIYHFKEDSGYHMSLTCETSNKHINSLSLFAYKDKTNLLFITTKVDFTSNELLIKVYITEDFKEETNLKNSINIKYNYIKSLEKKVEIIRGNEPFDFQHKNSINRLKKHNIYKSHIMNFKNQIDIEEERIKKLKESYMTINEDEIPF